MGSRADAEAGSKSPNKQPRHARVKCLCQSGRAGFLFGCEKVNIRTGIFPSRRHQKTRPRQILVLRLRISQTPSLLKGEGHCGELVANAICTEKGLHRQESTAQKARSTSTNIFRLNEPHDTTLHAKVKKKKKGCYIGMPVRKTRAQVAVSQNLGVYLVCRGAFKPRRLAEYTEMFLIH